MIVFVHGVPETAAVWRKVRAQIDRESVALALPGFGCARPSGFGATKDDYVGWLVGELVAIGEPVDLVGHDWGALLTYRVAQAHGGLLRSWAADVGNVAHPDYVWHAFAQIWQTPGEGEAFNASQEAAGPEVYATGLTTMGISYEDAFEIATGADTTMGDCILALYRSALPTISTDWGPWSKTSAPGLVIHASEDGFSDATNATAMAEVFGARFAVLEGAGHFWPYQLPEAGARLLQDFWSTLD